MENRHLEFSHHHKEIAKHHASWVVQDIQPLVYGHGDAMFFFNGEQKREYPDD